MLELSDSDLEKIREAEGDKLDLHKMIENTTFSADVKYYLHKILNCSVTIGKTVIHVGRAVLGLVKEIYTRFPDLTISLILAKFLPMILPSNIISKSIGKIITELLPLIGLKREFANNIKNDAIDQALSECASIFFSSLKASK